MSIYKKLFEAKKEIGKISKDSSNPFYKSKYFDINALLEHVEPVLHKHELLLLQPILENKVCSIIYDIEGTDFLRSEIELTNQTDPQKRGSEITYYRRYTLASLLGLQAEDDDANATVKTENKNTNANEIQTLWLNDKQLAKALSSDKETVQKTLDYYDGKTIHNDPEKGIDFKASMKKEYRTQLQAKLKA